MKKLKRIVLNSQEMRDITGGTGLIEACSCYCVGSIGAWHEYTESGNCPYPKGQTFVESVYCRSGYAQCQ